LSYPFGKEWSRRLLEGTIIAHIRNKYLGKTRPSLNQVIGVIKTVSKKLEAQEMSSIIDEIEQNLQILPTIQSYQTKKNRRDPKAVKSNPELNCLHNKNVR
jgi:hypothetical protein